MNVKALILALLLPVQAMAQGFAGLGTEADGFRRARSPAARCSFPPITARIPTIASNGGI